MNINSCSSVNFKGYVPVRYYAIDEEQNVVRPIRTKEYIKKCHGQLVRDLNHTSKTQKLGNFDEYYKSADPDYRRIPKVRSIYDKEEPVVHLVTGKDIDIVDAMAKNVGIQKSKSIDAFGHSHSFEAAEAAKSFYNNTKYFLTKRCSRIKSRNGENLTMRMYFLPQYKKNGEVKGFEFVKANFIKDKELNG